MDFRQFILLGIIVIIGWCLILMISATSDHGRPWFWQRFRAWRRQRRQCKYVRNNVEGCMGIPTRIADAISKEKKGQ